MTRIMARWQRLLFLCLVVRGLGNVLTQAKSLWIIANRAEPATCI